MDFLVANADWRNFLCNLPPSKAEIKFQYCMGESEGRAQSLLKEEEVVAQSLTEAEFLDKDFLSEARVSDLRLLQQTNNLSWLKVT